MARDRIKWIRGRKPGESPNYPYPNSYRSQQSREQKARALLDQWGVDVYHEPAKDPPAGESKQEIFYFKSERGRESPLPQFRRCHIVTVDIPEPEDPEDPENPGDPLDPEDGGMLEPPLPPVFPHPSPDEVPDLWGKSKVVFSVWMRWEYTLSQNGFYTPDSDKITYGTGFPAVIDSADTTVNDWRLRIDPLPEDSPPYPLPVSVPNLANETYTVDDAVKVVVEPGSSALSDELFGIRLEFRDYNIFSTADAEGLSINQLEAQRIPYWVGRKTWYGVFEQVPIVNDIGEFFGYEREQVESIEVYLFRYAGDIRDVPPFLDLNAPDLVGYQYVFGGDRDSPLVSTGLTAADIWDPGKPGDPPDIAEAVTPDDPGVDPVQPDEPYDPTSPSTPEDPDDPDYPDGDDFGDEPEDPLDPSPDEQPMKRYHCTCQDASRTETADLSSPWRSRWTDRSWTDSEAGADVHDGTAWCKHAIAVAMFMGEW